MKEPLNNLFDFCILIPCYNNQNGLLRSLQSINYNNNQFRSLIIDDGSHEPLQLNDLLAQLPFGFPISIIRLEKNQGITIALNTGLEWIKKNNDFLFVARLDCGDICDDQRFYKQVQFLKDNPNINLVGSWCLFKDQMTGFLYQYSTPTKHLQILKGMHFKNMFIHPTVMWRTSAMTEKCSYPTKFPHAEDYGFFYSIMENGECAVIPENLVTCEQNSKGISITYRKEQLKSRMKVVIQYGKSNVLKCVGVIKLLILMAVPYKLVLRIKYLLFEPI